METTRGLTRRLEALEQVANQDRALPCRLCGLDHAEAILNLERLQERYTGDRDALEPACGCSCCRPFLEDLAARYERVEGRR